MRTILTIALTLLIGGVVAQGVFKYRTESFATREYSEYYDEWEEWGDWRQSNNILIIFNVDNKNIKIYTEKIQEYHFISVGEFSETRDDKKSLELTAIDEEGIACTVEIVKHDDGIIHFYIRWKNIQIVYQATSV